MTTIVESLSTAVLLILIILLISHLLNNTASSWLHSFVSAAQ